MRTTALVMAAGLVSLCMTGCGWFGGKDDAEASAKKTAQGLVAVVDLDEVARRLGRDQYMANTLKQTQQTLSERLGVVQASYVEQIKKKQEEFGVGQEDIELSDEAVKKLLGMKRQAGLNLNQARKEALSSLNKQKLQLVGSFRSEVKPIAKEVAKEKGLSVVLTKNETVLFAHEDSVDITNEVVKRLKANGAAAPVARTAAQPRPVPPANGTESSQPTEQK